MQIPIINGIYSDASGDFRTFYPVNMVPVPKQHGISTGYLKPADGIVTMSEGQGADRGGIVWNGVCYRVSGTKLVSVSEAGAVTVLGDVGSGGYCSFTYSFDRLAVCSGGRLYYWSGSALTQVTDVDLGQANYVAWGDGYFVTTDGDFLVVTELNDPMAINPLKYGSAEVSPDKILSVMFVRNELTAINRYTIETYTNTGGANFPFSRIGGAHIPKGAVGRDAACILGDAIAFVGSGPNEAPAVYLGENGLVAKMSTREIDLILSEYTEAELATIVCETKSSGGQQHMLIHLPDRTLGYDIASTKVFEEHVWFVLTSSATDFARYRARGHVWAYGKWIVGDPVGGKIGYASGDNGHHYGDVVRWEIGTMIVYGEATGAAFHQLELIALTGRVESGKNPVISTSYSTDGVTWSMERPILAGARGERDKRLVWLQNGFMRQWRIQRFKGTSDSHLSIARLDAQLEPFAYG
jgi:hypothetical protein